MNKNFKKWLTEQEYVYDPTRRYRGWLIHSVMVNTYGTGYTAWSWDYTAWSWNEIYLEFKINGRRIKYAEQT